ncbi:hypothetical protein ACWDA7_45935 [Streptomyces sp. NPDC001156]
MAIVDALDGSNAESNLVTYRSAYGVPSCTTANGCFRKVNQNGQTSPLPSGDYGWGTQPDVSVCQSGSLSGRTMVRPEPATRLKAEGRRFDPDLSHHPR